MIEVKDLGLIDYKEAWDYQKQLFGQLYSNRVSEKENKINYLLFCEHPNVYTLGKNGNWNNLLLSEDELRIRNIDFYNIDRGGDITYHGPGQLVVYPIFDLDTFGIGAREFIYKLEELIINVMSNYHIVCSRLEAAAGIWVEPENILKSRKICAVGVKISRRITMHGIALNINTDLSYFNNINPCGFTDRGVTSMQKELGNIINLMEVKQLVNEGFGKEF